MLLADLPAVSPPPQALSDWLGVFFYLIGGLGAAVFLFKQATGRSDTTTIAPNPLSVREHRDAATQEDLKKINDEAHGRISRERREIDAELRRVEAATDKRMVIIEADLKNNTAMTSEINGGVKQLNTQVQQLVLGMHNNKR